MEALEIVAGSPDVFDLLKEKSSAAPAASFSDKNIPALGERTELNPDVLSVVVVPLEVLPPVVFKQNFLQQKPVHLN
ncbi:MAG: hypothetical protein MUO72_05955 [Bacteroidales bacterium]|nr:hypothetical protein [Bacteroidales bacterium]